MHPVSHPIKATACELLHLGYTSRLCREGDTAVTAPNVSICLSPDADTLQTHAANELQQYLVELFGAQAQVVSGTTDGQQCRIVLGLITDAHLLASSRDLPLLSEQGYLLRRTDSDTSRSRSSQTFSLGFEGGCSHVKLATWPRRGCPGPPDAGLPARC